MIGRTSRGPVKIGPLQVAVHDGNHRVEARVDGVPVWFESRDRALRAAPEAFGSAFLLPALHAGAALESEMPFDPVWLANASHLLTLLRDWWRYPVLPPRAPGAAATDGAATNGATGARAGAALFFSGGVDSFYSLLCTDETPTHLIGVQGFDIPLDDAWRAGVMDESLRAIAHDRGLTPVLVRTNLREHPLFRAVEWERSHGGALAAVAHVLGDVVPEVRISSSILQGRTKPWGSRWDLDPLHSSSRVRIRQVGYERRRSEKVRHIAGHPLVQRHLRVCWENRTSAANCSVCEKCVITRLALAECGALDACRTLAGTATLARDLDGVANCSHNINALARLSASPALPPDVARAAQALLRRSRHVQSWPVVARRAVLRRVLAWTGGTRP